jgi:hypothetical protein
MLMARNHGSYHPFLHDTAFIARVRNVFNGAHCDEVQHIFCTLVDLITLFEQSSFALFVEGYGSPGSQLPGQYLGLTEI